MKDKISYVHYSNSKIEILIKYKNNKKNGMLI